MAEEVIINCSPFRLISTKTIHGIFLPDAALIIVKP
jgi:hypothetical protein